MQLTTGTTEQLGGEVAIEKWMSMPNRLDSEWRPLVFVSLNIHVTRRTHGSLLALMVYRLKSTFLYVNEACMGPMWDP